MKLLAISPRSYSGYRKVKQRNPGMSRKDYEKMVAEYLDQET